MNEQKQKPQSEDPKRHRDIAEFPKQRDASDFGTHQGERKAPAEAPRDDSKK